MESLGHNFLTPPITPRDPYRISAEERKRKGEGWITYLGKRLSWMGLLCGKGSGRSIAPDE
jgi:hypothetical protein